MHLTEFYECHQSLIHFVFDEIQFFKAQSLPKRQPLRLWNIHSRILAKQIRSTARIMYYIEKCDSKYILRKTYCTYYHPTSPHYIETASNMFKPNHQKNKQTYHEPLHVWTTISLTNLGGIGLGKGGGRGELAVEVVEDKLWPQKSDSTWTPSFWWIVIFHWAYRI